MSVYLAWSFATLNKRLEAELVQVETLSEKTRAQEEERQRFLETRQDELEREVALRTEQLRGEKQKSDTLLRNILPEEVAEELKEKGYAQARLHNNVTVLFTDFVDFTRHSEKLTPGETVAELDGCFRAFDEIITRHGLEKIKTIGDAYMAVAGLPVPHRDGAVATVRAAVDIRDYIAHRRLELPHSFDIRIGVHSGAVVAGIIGVKKFAYDVWGDTVNTAARIEQSSEAGKVNISSTTYALVKDRFLCEYRGEIAAKGKGVMAMYFVEKEFQP
jgi:class 3 adenylate cyclase